MTLHNFTVLWISRTYAEYDALVAKNTVFVEPFGHFSSLSKLERVWTERAPGCAVYRRRIQSFDPLSGVSFSPMEYWFGEIDYSHVAEVPSREWIDDAFIEFVKGEFNEGIDRRPPQNLPEVVDTKYADDDIFQRYMLDCERKMLYPFYDLADRHTKQDLIENFRRLLSDASLGNKKNQKFAPFEDIAMHLERWASEEARILCLLPSFPFKDQSLLRVGAAKADAYDLGEIALLIRLHLLSLAFYQFHPWGVDWMIAADGNFYADMFGISRKKTESYFLRLRSERSSLNLSGTVSILDLEEIIEHYGIGCKAEFERDKTAVYERLRWISKTEDEKLKKAFAVLKRGMRQNQSTRDIEEEVSTHDLWKICNWETLEGDESARVVELHNNLDAKATNIAVAYAAENIILRRHDVLNKVFPEAIRTTIHAKPGQVAVPQLGSCFPWNGVAFVANPEQFSAKALQVKRFHELSRNTPKLTAYKDRNSGSTLFYSKSGEAEG